MKEQNKVRKNSTNCEITKQIDNKMRHRGKHARHHQKKRNTLRKNTTRKNGLQRERTGQNEKNREREIHDKKEMDKTRKNETK